MLHDQRSTEVKRAVILSRAKDLTPGDRSLNLLSVINERLRGGGGGGGGGGRGTAT